MKKNPKAIRCAKRGQRRTSPAKTNFFERFGSWWQCQETKEKLEDLGGQDGHHFLNLCSLSNPQRVCYDLIIDFQSSSQLWGCSVLQGDHDPGQWPLHWKNIGWLRGVAAHSGSHEKEDMAQQGTSMLIATMDDCDDPARSWLWSSDGW